MSHRRIVLKPGERQSVRARPAPGQKYTDKPIIIMDPGDVVTVSHSEAAPEPPPPPPPPPDPAPDVDYIVTEKLNLQAQSLTDYMGMKVPTPDGNVLWSWGAHIMHSNGDRHEHGFEYGRDPSEGQGRRSFHDLNYSHRRGASHPPPNLRVEDTDWELVGGGIVKANGAGVMYRLAVEGGQLAWRAI